jgi:hypothetical protein
MTAFEQQEGNVMANVSQAGKAVADYQKARQARRGQPEAQERPKRSDACQELPERTQHGKLIDRPTEHAGIVGRVSQPPIDRLFIRKSVSARMHSAAQMLRTDFEIGIIGAMDVDGELPPGIRGSGLAVTPSERRIDAITAYKRAMRCMGAHVGAVVVAVCCYERDVSAVAKGQGRHRHRVMGVLEDGLKTLADHYRLTGVDDYAQDVDARARRVA